MMLARVCRGGTLPPLVNFLKSPVTSKPLIPRIQSARLFASDGRGTYFRSARRSATVKEQVMAPAGEGAFNVGKGAVAGGAVIGLGALCYYGLGLSSSTGAIDNAGLWPQYVRDRIKDTYLYFGATVVTSAASAAACLRSPTVLNMVSRQGWGALAVTMIAMIGSGMLVHSMPYQEGFGAKQMAWLAHSSILGGVLAPLYFLGGPLIVRAAWYTAGAVCGLSAIAVSAPSEKFLQMGGPLALGLGVVFASSVGSMFLPPTTVLGSGLHAMTLYGGLILFSMLLLYDTQKIIKQAETHPKYGYNLRPYDPINNAISIYLDTLNIFTRILMILAGGGSNRRK